MDDPILEALNRVPTEVTDEDLERIISYIRKAKASFEASGKSAKKEGADIDLVKALNIPPAYGKFTRRF